METFKNYLSILALGSLILAFSLSVRGQNVGINSKGNKPSSDAVLDLRTGNLGSALGFLPNEVSLSATNSASPFTTPDTGLVVYNYATAGTSPNNVVPGYYYWDGSEWDLMLAPSSAGISGYVLTSNGGGAPSWTSITGIGAVRYIGTSYLGLNSGAGGTGTSEGTSSNLYNVNIGLNAGYSNTTGNYNIAIGDSALLSNTTGFANIAIGANTLQHGGKYDVAIGLQALQNNTSGFFNSAYGYRTLQSNTSAINNSAFGAYALQENTGVANSAFGSSALYSNTSGQQNIAFGEGAGDANTTGNYNSYMGTFSGNTNTTGNYNTFIGYSADASSSGLNNATAIGAGATVSESNALILGSGANVGIGTSSPSQNLEVVGTTKTTNLEMTNGATYGYVLQSDSNGNGTWVNPSSLSGAGAIHYIGTSYLGLNSGAGGTGTSEGTSSNLYNLNIGINAGYSNTTGNYNIAIGDSALLSNTTGFANIAIGANTLQHGGKYDIAIGLQALQNNTFGEYNSAYGYQALQSNVSADNNSAFGAYALQKNTGVSNSAFGSSALYSNTSGQSNVAVGVNAGNGNTTGSENIYIGEFSGGGNTTGSNNTYIGYLAQPNVDGLTNATAIGNGASVSESNALILGYEVKVGIGTSSPTQKLEVVGTTKTTNLEMTNGATNGYVLQSDSNGNGTWVNPSSFNSSVWTTSGNNIYNNNSGNVGIGTSSPSQSLDVEDTNTDCRVTVASPSGAEAVTQFSTYSSGSPLARWEIGKTDVGETGGNSGSDLFVNRYDDNGNYLSQPFVIIRSTGNVGIGTSSPSQALQVVGTTETTNFEMTNGATFGYVLQSDSNGNGTWVNPSTGLGAVRYVGTSYLGLNSGRGSTGTSEGTSSDLYNVIIGDSAGNTLATGNNCIAIGDGAMNQDDQFNNLVAIGAGALANENLQSGGPGLDGDIGIGYLALNNAVNSNGNVAIGYKSQSNIGDNCSNNTTVGYLTGAALVGPYNTAVGYQALSSGTGGIDGENCAFGYQALKNDNGGYNNAFGSYALYDNSGTENVAMGYLALYSNTTGARNTAVGYYAGYAGTANTTGTNNTFIGYEAQASNHALTNATAIGAGAMVSESNALVLGSGANVGIGTSSPTAILHTVASGAKTATYSGNLLTCTAISSTSSITKAGLEIQSTGTWNGTSANNIGLYVSSVTGGSNNYDAIFNGGGNVGIGTTTPSNLFTVAGSLSANTFAASIQNSANIANAEGLSIEAGQTAYTGASSYIQFIRPDATAIGSISQNSSTSVLYNTTSDERLKENIVNTKMGIADLMKIKICDYNYIGEQGNPQTGYLAQQLYTVFPNAVHVGGANAKTDPWMVDYGRITPLLVKSIQDQQKIIEDQQKQIDELKKAVEQLQQNKKQ